jgi:hypothetical protein
MDPMPQWAESHVVPHAEVAKVLLKVGYSREQIQEKLRDLPDPIDTTRYGDELYKRGIDMGQLIERMGGRG